MVFILTDGPAGSGVYVGDATTAVVGLATIVGLEAAVGLASVVGEGWMVGLDSNVAVAVD